MNIIWNPVKWEPFPNLRHIHICQTGESLFAIRDAVGNCLNKENELEYEPLPSNRDDAFFKRCRYSSLKEAQDQYEAWVLKCPE